MATEIRNRVKELRFVKASELKPNLKNWRTHPAKQRKAMQEVLTQLGYADALIARETPDGLQLIDGHLRAETTPEQEVPVLIVDLDDGEADALLAVLDPLAGLANANDEVLRSLTEGLSDTLRTLSESILMGKGHQLKDADEMNLSLQERFDVLIELGSEAEQREVYEHCKEEGWKCRPLIS